MRYVATVIVNGNNEYFVGWQNEQPKWSKEFAKAKLYEPYNANMTSTVFVDDWSILLNDHNEQISGAPVKVGT